MKGFQKSCITAGAPSANKKRRSVLLGASASRLTWRHACKSAEPMPRLGNLPPTKVLRVVSPCLQGFKTFFSPNRSSRWPLTVAKPDGDTAPVRKLLFKHVGEPESVQGSKVKAQGHLRR